MRKTTIVIVGFAFLAATKVSWNAYQLLGGTSTTGLFPGILQESSGEKPSEPIMTASMIPFVSISKVESPQDQPEPGQSAQEWQSQIENRCRQQHAPSCRLFFSAKQKACEQGVLADCDTVAWLHLEGAAGIVQNASLALRSFEEICAKGGHQACASLGAIYRDGKEGVRIDMIKSVSYFKQNCTDQNTSGCHELLTLYQEGRAPFLSPDQVFSWMRQGCDHEEAYACKWLVERYVAEASIAAN